MMIYNPYVYRLDYTSFRARARFATGNSDLLTDAKAYEECLSLRNKGESQGAIRAFCEQASLPTIARTISPDAER